MKIVVYTSNIDGFDKPLATPNVVQLNNKIDFIDPRKENRKYKILSHLYFDCDVSIYMDANIELIDTPQQIVEKHLGNADIAVHEHPHRQCIYAEAHAVVSLQKEDQAIIDQQISFYKSQGYPANNRLFECGFIIRRHNHKTEAFNEAWFAQVCRFSKRDQLSFPYVLSLSPTLSVRYIPGNIRNQTFINFNKHQIR